MADMEALDITREARDRAHTVAGDDLDKFLDELRRLAATEPKMKEAFTMLGYAIVESEQATRH
jgi:hypothetical protein